MAEGTKVIVGLQGDSAADVARQHGFVGTDAEWVASMEQAPLDAATAKEAAIAAAALVNAPAGEVVRTVVNADIANPGSALSTALSATIDGSITPLVDQILGTYGLLRGVQSFGLGNSWVASASGGVTQYASRVAARLGTTYTSMATSGYRMQDTATVLVKEGDKKWASRVGGMVIINDLLNNLIEADTPENRAAALEGLRAVCALASSSSRIESSTATVMSGFTSSAQAHASGGTLMQATAEAAYIDMTIPTDGTYYLLAHGSNGLGFSGTNWTSGVMTATQGAKTWTKDFNSLAQNTWLAVSNGFNPVVMKLDGAATGTVRFTHTKAGRANAIGVVDALLPKSATPPLIVIVKPVTVTAATHAKPSLFTYLRIVPDTVAAEFPNVLVVDPEPGWSPSTMLLSDGLHPSETGAAYLNDFVSRAVAVEMLRRARQSQVNALV